MRNLLNTTLQNDEFRERTEIEVAALVEKIHLEQNANIIILLCYMTKSAFLLDKLIEKARTTFAKFATVDFLRDCKFLDDISFMAPKLTVDESSLENQKEYNRNLDELERRKEQALATDDRQVSEDGFEEVNDAFRSIQIIGQTLRNFAGSLEGELKVRMTKECYLLGLRTVRALLSDIEEGLPIYKFYTREFLIRKGFYEKTFSSGGLPLEEKLDANANKVLFACAQLICVAIIRNLAFSIASPELNIVYEEVLDSRNDLQFKIIDASIKMEKGNFPGAEKLFALFDSVEESPFTQGVVRLMCHEFLYLNNVDPGTRQSVCKRMGFSLTNKSLIANPSKG